MNFQAKFSIFVDAQWYYYERYKQFVMLINYYCKQRERVCNTVKRG